MQTAKTFSLEIETIARDKEIAIAFNWVGGGKVWNFFDAGEAYELLKDRLQVYAIFKDAIQKDIKEW